MKTDMGMIEHNEHYFVNLKCVICGSRDFDPITGQCLQEKAEEAEDGCPDDRASLNSHMIGITAGV